MTWMMSWRNKTIYIKVPVQKISLTDMESVGWELTDNRLAENKTYGGLFKEGLLQVLTRRQREVVFCLYNRALTRKETAKSLGVSLQAIHQIVLRIRKRLKEKAGVVWRK